MRRPFATIARFASRNDAEQAHTQLIAAGIESQLHHELAAGSADALEITLRVPQADAERASQLLGGWSSLVYGSSAIGRCLICQSSLVEVQAHSLPVRIGIALLLQAFPMPRAWFEPRGRRCGVCGHEWRDDPAPDSAA